MTFRSGQRNALTDIDGIRVGNAEDHIARTGVTIVRFDHALRCAVDVRGGGPATRETHAVGSDGTLGIAHAIALSGGSVFGLGAADTVATKLSAQKEGIVPVAGTPPVPIVPAASLYDLNNGGDKSWGEGPPYGRLAAQAMEYASKEVKCGSVGAGFGALAGAWLGGLGTVSLDLGDRGAVAAMVAVNSIGSPVMPSGDCFWAWPFEVGQEFGGLQPNPSSRISDPLPRDAKGGVAVGQATCIGIIAISVPVDRASLRRIAIMAQDGLARAIRPSHAPFDGDTIFAVCPNMPSIADTEEILHLGSAAADCVARAVARGVWEASAETDRAPSFRRASVSR